MVCGQDLAFSGAVWRVVQRLTHLQDHVQGRVYGTFTDNQGQQTRLLARRIIHRPYRNAVRLILPQPMEDLHFLHIQRQSIQAPNIVESKQARHVAGRREAIKETGCMIGEDTGWLGYQGRMAQ